jgi:hypothetical protein
MSGRRRAQGLCRVRIDSADGRVPGGREPWLPDARSPLHARCDISDDRPDDPEELDLPDGCERDKASLASAKAKTYDWYDVPHPANNTGKARILTRAFSLPCMLNSESNRY